MNLHDIMLAAQLAGKNGGENVDLSDYYTKSQTDNLIAGKVDKVSGKGLSTNDFTNADKSRLDGLENYDDAEIKADIAEVASQTVLNRSTLGYQRKNLLLNNCKGATKNGVTATVNDDKSITLTGSNTFNAAFVLYWNMQTGSSITQYDGNKKWVPNGRYIVSGGKSKVKIQVYCSNTNNTIERGVESYDGIEKAFNVTSNDNYVWTRIYIDKSANFSEPVTIYPMIRLAEITDDTYEPYKPSVAEYIASLEERIAALESMNLTANSLNSSLNTAEINTTEEEFDND